MLNNLKAELIRKNKNPNLAIMQAIGCSERTARNKLSGDSPFTVPEAVKVIETHFSGKRPTIDYLFANDDEEERG